MTKAEEYSALVNALDPSEHHEEALEEVWDHVREIQSEFIESHRWYNLTSSVYFCDDGSFFKVLWCDPATEMQEGQDYDAEAYPVEPYETVTVKYRKITEES